MRSFALPSLLCLALSACGSSGGSGGTGGGTDAAVAADITVIGVDTPRVTGGDAGRDAGRDASRDASTADLPPSNAGAPCTADGQCGGTLTCDTESPGGYCTGDCTDNADPTNEARQCGGAGATCVTDNEDPADASPFCARACDPNARTESAGACRAGYYCTGFWFWRESGEPDRPGCVFFCATDGDCPGARCNTRTGACSAEGVVTSRRAEGEPCNPMNTNADGESTECKGFCVLTGNMPTHGVCMAEINLRTTNACPERPMVVLPLAAYDENDNRLDNSGICAWRNCTTSGDCTAPLRCIDPGDGSASYCDWPETGTEVTPGDGGVRDGGVRDAARD
jgi:hypothetical protein